MPVPDYTIKTAFIKTSDNTKQQDTVWCKWKVYKFNKLMYCGICICKSFTFGIRIFHWVAQMYLQCLWHTIYCKSHQINTWKNRSLLWLWYLLQAVFNVRTGKCFQNKCINPTLRGSLIFFPAKISWPKHTWEMFIQRFYFDTKVFYLLAAWTKTYS